MLSSTDLGINPFFEARSKEISCAFLSDFFSIIGTDEFNVFIINLAASITLIGCLQDKLHIKCLVIGCLIYFKKN